VLRRLARRRAETPSLDVAFTGQGRVELLSERVGGPQPGHAIARTRCSLISTGTEITCLERRFAEGSHWDRWVAYPFRPGYCSIGIVEEVGKGVRSLQPGDRVAAHVPHAQYAQVSESDATIVPEGIPDDEAAWFALACIVQIAFRRVSIESGDTVAIIGTGVLGQLAVQYARRAGAAQVIAIGRSQPRVQAAADHGATQLLALEAGDAVPKVLDLTGNGANVVFDITGNPGVLPSALRMAGPRGTVVLLGDSGFPEEQRLAGDLLLKGLRLVGVHFEHASSDEHAEMAQAFFASLQTGEICVADLITDRFDPRDAPAAYAKLSAHPSSTIGVLFDWTRL